jgi:hypothetical protein
MANRSGFKKTIEIPLVLPRTYKVYMLYIGKTENELTQGIIRLYQLLF